MPMFFYSRFYWHYHFQCRFTGKNWKGPVMPALIVANMSAILAYGLVHSPQAHINCARLNYSNLVACELRWPMWRLCKLVIQTSHKQRENSSGFGWTVRGLFIIVTHVLDSKQSGRLGGSDKRTSCGWILFRYTFFVATNVMQLFWLWFDWFVHSLAGAWFIVKLNSYGQFIVWPAPI